MVGVLLPLLWQPAAGGGLRRAGADALAEWIGPARTGPVQGGEPEAANHDGPACLAVAAEPADVGAERLVPGAREARRRPREEEGDRRPGAQAARCVVEVCQQRRRHRGCGDEGRLSALAVAFPFGRTLIRS